MFIDEMLALKVGQAGEGQAGLQEGASRQAHRQWREYNEETLAQ